MDNLAIDLSALLNAAPAFEDEPVGAMMLHEKFHSAPLAMESEIAELCRRVAVLERQTEDLRADNVRLEQRARKAEQRISTAFNSPADAIRSATTVRSAFDLRAHLAHVRQWSEKTFGPGQRTKTLINDIIKELLEIEQRPGDLMEWVDVVTLGFDGAWRCGHTPAEIVNALALKQLINESRVWPDWRSFTPGQAIQHLRTGPDHHAPPSSADTVN